MKKVGLLNDTRTQYHHGCELVIAQIERAIAARGGRLHAILDEGADWQKKPAFLKRLKECDVLIVNGEGTIHDDRPAGRQLLEIVDFTSKYRIPAFLINATYQNNPPDYREFLKRFERIFVRESKSKTQINELGCEAEIVPDLTLGYNPTLGNQKFNNSRSSSTRQGVSDSAIRSIAESLFSYAISNGQEFMPVLRSTRNQNTKSLVEGLRQLKHLAYVHSKYKHSKDYLLIRNLHLSNTVEDYIQRINSCDSVITGRFHVACFCLLVGTPFYAIEGNSHKISSMIQDVGLNPDRIIRLADMADGLNFEYMQYSEEEVKNLAIFLDRARKSIKDMFDAILIR